MTSMPVIANNQPFLRFCLRDKRLFISRTTIDLLGNMPYTGFQWSMPTRTLKLCGMRDETENAVRITRYSGQEYVFQRAVFNDGILLFMGWDRQLSYKVYSEPIVEPYQVVFRLDKAGVVGSIITIQKEGVYHA